MIKNPPKGLFLSLSTFSLLSSSWNCPSLMKDILSMMRIFTSLHICLFSSGKALFLNINTALHIVIPPIYIEAVPVYFVKRNMSSLHCILAAWKNSNQKHLSTLIAEIIPAPAGPDKNIISCS